ncbi:50S ribosomal protein L3 [Acholeplasma laidlawii]|jgi:large subunit ribosomal protein L3|uniref:Large ribosomal subunit protein uL3 n=1 Tax=Acholeplasma laidlawii (strain PG-8A) TaxID=441768 RepID=RL3_ACHLI|nr:50S ribosomal protein L3 [Acholeplasma laidlawii]A9NED3.1 RecName: Full=Large ribosomal subunit protein uL3; AltName: Full=50S ribosomal protein L3 [Acholeplasma laidlawii PG-8A]ABX80713.1 large subunit ribosomal protein L3 [Acholeplasma laidlawii PG-8A]NWH10727.1 50S ribosomal protein L3 [Acholeplasma laidlawii]OAN19422.1 50S ribosomal protein L3 [Acholeplasma laidlawii]OED27675.1 50S ribosomal protein L3 [Acholeplasma laidlawii]OED29245.1 50S ribosomal protein L3 [Acholeplasma laidlawii]|eukprot:Sdes_comp17480_c0_seq1m6714
MAKGILGRKIGMTQIFDENGVLIPVTVIDVEGNVVLQQKTVEVDGYQATQVGFESKREKLSNKPELGHVKKANTAPKRFVKEIRFDALNNELLALEVGTEIKADLFTAGEDVDVTGTSKGKGFQGNIKRHNQSRGPMTHGSRYHRGVGSLGAIKGNMKGKNLPGQMGNEQVTVQNLKIVAVDTENDLLLVSGSVPGPRKGYVVVRSAIKKGN